MRSTRPTSWSSRAAPSTRPPCCCARLTTVTRRDWPTVRVSLAATTCAIIAPPSWPFRMRPNPTVFQKTLALNDFYFRSDDWDYPLGEIQLLGKTDGEILKGEVPNWAGWTPTMALDDMARHSVDFWLQSEDFPEPQQPCDARRQGKDRPSSSGHQRRGPQALDRKAQGHAHGHRLPRAPATPFAVLGQKDSDRRNGPSERHHPLRSRSKNISAGRQLPRLTMWTIFT